MTNIDEALAAYLRTTPPEERSSETAFQAGAAWATDELATLRERVQTLEGEKDAYGLAADLNHNAAMTAAKERDTLRAENARLREALGRISELTPGGANARNARDMHLTVKAIADTALAQTEAENG